jgi:hypothetical protein
MLAFAVGQPNLGVHKSLVSQIWAFISRAARKMMARAADNGCKRLTPSRRTARRSKRWCSQGNSPTRTSLGSSQGTPRRSTPASVKQLRLAHEQQQMPQPQELWQLMQQFAKTQQQNLGMGSMNGMGMRAKIRRLGCGHQSRCLFLKIRSQACRTCRTCKHRYPDETRNKMIDLGNVMSQAARAREALILELGRKKEEVLILQKQHAERGSARHNTSTSSRSLPLAQLATERQHEREQSEAHKQRARERGRERDRTRESGGVKVGDMAGIGGTTTDKKSKDPRSATLRSTGR